MKTAIAAILALGLIAGTANARSPFDALNESAPRADIFSDIATSAPRSPFADLALTAPRSVFEDLQSSAPRSDGVFGTLETSAP